MGLAYGMGVKAVSADSPNDLKSAVKQALGSGKPCLIDAAIELEPLER